MAEKNDIVPVAPSLQKEQEEFKAPTYSAPPVPLSHLANHEALAIEFSQHMMRQVRENHFLGVDFADRRLREEKRDREEMRKRPTSKRDQIIDRGDLRSNGFHAEWVLERRYNDATFFVTCQYLINDNKGQFGFTIPDNVAANSMRTMTDYIVEKCRESVKEVLADLFMTVVKKAIRRKL